MASKTTVGLAALRPEFAPVGTVGVAHGLGHLAREAKGRRVRLWISTEDEAEIYMEELAVFSHHNIVEVPAGGRLDGARSNQTFDFCTAPVPVADAEEIGDHTISRARLGKAINGNSTHAVRRRGVGVI